MSEIYHMTHINNLKPILASGLIHCKNRLPSNLLNVDVANVDVQSRRLNKTVGLAKGGNLHDYVPFYFAPRSPMLYALHKNNVEGYQDGQNPMIYIVSRAEHIPKGQFIFTDGHPIMAFSSFFDDLAQLQEIDWEVMRARFWNDSQEDPDRKRRRQAEFLVYQVFDLRFVDFLAVKSYKYQNQVLDLLKKAGLSWDVRIMPDWYY